MSLNSGFGTFFSKLKQYYDVLPPKVEGMDREGFEKSLVECMNAVEQREHDLIREIEELRHDFVLSRKEHDLSLRDWKDRYDKLFLRWKDCLSQIERLQRESEEAREEKELLLKQERLNQKNGENSSTLSFANQKEVLRKFFLENVLFELLHQLTVSFDCRMSSVFVCARGRRLLRTLACVNRTLKREEQLGIQIEIPSDKGIAGFVFRHKQAVNVLHPYEDKRFYRRVDKELGNVTNTVLCFPLIGLNTGDTMGVVQFINKNGGRPFDLRDEERLREVSDLISVVLEGAGVLFPGRGWMSLGNSSSDSSSNPASSSVHVTRIGETKEDRSPLISSFNTEKDSSSSFQSNNESSSNVGMSSSFPFSGGMISKQVEDYIIKLNGCWKRSVQESSSLRNEKELFLKERQQHEKEIVVLKSELKSVQQQLDEMIQKNKKQMEHFRKKRREWNLLIMKKNKENKKLSKQHQLQQQETQFNLQQQNSYLKRKSFHQQLLNHSSSGSLFFNLNNINNININNINHINNQNSNQQEQQKENDKKLLNDPLVSLCLPQQPSKRKRKKKQSISSPSSCSSGSSSSSFSLEGLFEESFDQNPCAMILCSHDYRIWRANQKFNELLGLEEGGKGEAGILGILFSEICSGVDAKSLQKLFQFDVVQGLGLDIKKKKVIKVTMQIKRFGRKNWKTKRKIKSPMYTCVFYKQKKE